MAGVLLLSATMRGTTPHKVGVKVGYALFQSPYLTHEK